VKKIGAVLIIFILLFNIAGFYLLFQIKRWSIREEVEQKLKKTIPEKYLTRIEITPQITEEIEWEEENEEFSFRGDMYDLAYQKKIGNKIYYYCFKDDEETYVVNQLDQTVNNLLDVGKFPPNKVSKDFIKAFCALHFILSKSITSLSYQEIHSLIFEIQSNNYSEVFSLRDSPPPEH